jgi:hypothetical protein
MISMDDIDNAEFDQFAAVVTGHQPFAGSDGHLGPQGDTLHGLDVFGRARLFDKQQLVGFHLAAEDAGHGRRGLGVKVDAGVDLFAEIHAQRHDMLDGPRNRRMGFDPFEVAGNAAFDGGDAQLPGLGAHLAHLGGRVGADVVVAGHTGRVVGAAEEFIDGLLENLAADIPRGLIDGGNRRADDGPGAIEAMDVPRLPVVLDRHGVGADQKLFEVLDAVDGSGGFAFEPAFAPAVDALVGFDFDEDIRAVGLFGCGQGNAKGLDVGDAEIRTHGEEFGRAGRPGGAARIVLRGLGKQGASADDSSVEREEFTTIDGSH